MFGVKRQSPAVILENCNEVPFSLRFYKFSTSDDFGKTLYLWDILACMLDRTQNVSSIHAKLTELWVHQQTNIQTNKQTNK